MKNLAKILRGSKRLAGKKDIKEFALSCGYKDEKTDPLASQFMDDSIRSMLELCFILKTTHYSIAKKLLVFPWEVRSISIRRIGRGNLVLKPRRAYNTSG